MTVDLQPGASFGEYVLEQRLGGGGFGEVWLSRDAAGVPVAVKVMRGQYSSTDEGKVRAEIELLAAAASSRSSHIVRVLDGGSDPAPYIVLEYVEGIDLGSEIALRGVLPLLEVLRIAESIAEALETLQQVGIIHRDIKPANVMIDSHGVIKLADFGIAKIVGIDVVTATGQMPMSMAYAAPEVWEGSASHLSDHYAFGALLYQCLTGHPPFNGSYAEIYRHHVMTAPDLGALPIETPPSLRSLISGCLAKEPGQRPSSARAIQRSISKAQEELTPHEPTAVRSQMREPKRLGPWVIDAKSADEAWTFACHHESTGEKAVLEVHFSDDLSYGDALRRTHSGRTSRLLLRPGEGWRSAPVAEFLFWLTRTETQAVLQPGLPQPGGDSPSSLTLRKTLQKPRSSHQEGRLSLTQRRASGAIALVAGAVGMVAALAVGLFFALGGGDSKSNGLYEPSTIILTPVASALVTDGLSPAAISSTSQPARIAFASVRDGNNEVYVMGADGSNQTRLTSAPADDWQPSWSPDGRRIAFSSNRDGNYEIYVMNADGSGQTNLTDNAGYDWSPVWSPDGRRIAFSSSRDGNFEIYVMNADGSGQSRLTNNLEHDQQPAWSPDGTRIAFASIRDGNIEIYVMNADGSAQTRLTNNRALDWEPAWSPDGRRLVFTSDRDGNSRIYVMNADGSGQTSLTQSTATDSEPAWSPDGRRIAFSSNRDGNREVYVMNADGSSQIRVTNNTRNNFSPTWSP